MEKERSKLEVRKFQMKNLFGKGKHIVKVGNHPHIYDIRTSNYEKMRAQLQEIGNAFEIKRQAT